MLKQRLRRRQSRRGPLPLKVVFLLSCAIFIVLTVQGLILVEKGVRPTIIAIAKTETQRIATLAINDAISSQILEESHMEDVLIYEYDQNQQVNSVQLNPVIVNRVLQETTKRVQNYLNDIEQGKIRDYHVAPDDSLPHDGASFSEDGIIHMIPLGQATKNALLAHLGPEIPVRLSAIGDVKSQMKHEVMSVGINNAYLSVSVDIEVDVKVVIPFATDTAVVKTAVPVTMVWLPGDVPDYYGGSGTIPAVINPNQGGGG
ncbi:sporulation protein YunB [Paenalkalicoccus suaedae]|uniref:Sporulation protein YunB n=1 Tax=Paenalkalicoccus suaedae TaxID=2592382 RepID=A0A859FGH1_9BACI|nr:sporulation protein YunB [Paenalkalicoccus suaedae]QKS72197.1 sporulation protein YunB [Paenalkalicoccus suaedae]